MKHLLTTLAFLISLSAYAVVDGVNQTLSTATLVQCNNGTIERNWTSCPNGWSAGPIVAPPAGVIFSENFDSQPDWHSGLAINNTGAYPVNGAGPDQIQYYDTHTIPQNWRAIAQNPEWAPSKGQPLKHESIEIFASNSDKARGGTGKSYVQWRESWDNGPNSWISNAQMCKYFPEGYDELYVEFWIRFDDNWTVDPGWTTKMFRIASWRGNDSPFKAFSGGNLGPIMLWDGEIGGYGVRNRLSLRGGPHGDNYGFSEGDIAGLPRTLNGQGDMSLNFTGDVQGMGPGGTNPQIPDVLNGGFITSNPNITINHNQIFGPAGTWTKLAFYVKMNSAPGVADGIMTEWLNDVQIFHSAVIPWIRPSATEDENAKWNAVYIGGNSYFPNYLQADQHEEWFAIDDIVVMSGLPEDKQ
jgi:hypothetical protein